jgi:outer membrane biosynthesis protein TonB
MRDGVLLSGTLHIIVLLLVLFGLPFFWEPETVHMTATPITVVTSDQLMAPKVAQEQRTDVPQEKPPEPVIPPAPPAPTLPEPEVIPEPPAAPEETQNETPPAEAPNPEPQESANPQEEDTPDPVIAEPPPEPPPPEPVPVPVPTEQVAEVQDVPIPPQKPEPPKKKEVKKKDEKKPVNDEQFLDSLVDKLAKEQTAALPPQEEAPADEPQTEGIPQRLPAGEEDALRNYIRGCWFSSGGGASASELVVTLEIKLNPDATLRGVEISRKDRGRMGDPVFRSFAESAKRAVDKCGADRQPFPLNLQRDYAVWGYILARFRESDFY